MNGSILNRYENEILPSFSKEQLLNELQQATLVDEYGSHSHVIQLVKDEIYERIDS